MNIWKLIYRWLSGDDRSVEARRANAHMAKWVAKIEAEADAAIKARKRAAAEEE